MANSSQTLLCSSRRGYDLCWDMINGIAHTVVFNQHIYFSFWLINHPCWIRHTSARPFSCRLASRSLSIIVSYEFLFFCFPVFISMQNHLLRELLSSIKLCEPTLEELFCSSDTWAANSFQQEEPALPATRVPCCTLGGATGLSKPASSQFLWVWVPQWPGCSPEYQALHQHS